MTTLAGRDRYPDTRMGIILSTTRYAPFSLVTGIIGLISFVFTLTTWLRVLWGNFTTAGMIFFLSFFSERIAYIFLFLIDFEKKKTICIPDHLKVKKKERNMTRRKSLSLSQTFSQTHHRSSNSRSARVLDESPNGITRRTSEHSCDAETMSKIPASAREEI